MIGQLAPAVLSLYVYVATPTGPRPLPGTCFGLTFRRASCARMFRVFSEAVL